MAGNLSGKMEELFNKQIPVSMKKGEREERFVLLAVCQS